MKLTKLNIKEINRLKSLFPSEISVTVWKSEDNGLVCEIKTFPGVFTQGENLFELVQMINDALYVYFDIPEKFIPYMPQYNPSVKMAHDFGGFPLPENKKFNLKLLNREASFV